MKKFWKPLASLIAATTLAGTAWAENWGYHSVDRSWIVIQVAGTQTGYNLEGSSSPSFQNADLGTIVQGGALTIVKYDTKTWKNENAGGDVSGCAYSYQVDDGTPVSMGGGWLENRGWDGASLNQLWGNGSVNAAIDTSTLTPGRHTLTIYGEISGGSDPVGPISEGPYTAGFVVSTGGGGGGEPTAHSVTYTVQNKTSVEVTAGDEPDGASSDFEQTGSNNQVSQLLGGTHMTLTLSGYEGVTITGLTLSMKSNSSKGEGSLSVTCGGTTIASIPDSKFSSQNWHGGWSTTYVNVTPSVTQKLVDDDIVITIEASANSLYCESFTIAYTSGGGSSDFTVSLDPSAAFTVGVGETATVVATPHNAAEGRVTYEWKIGNDVQAGVSGYVLTLTPAVADIGNHTVTCTATDSSTPTPATTDPATVSYTVVQKYDVTIDPNIQNGTVTVNPARAAEDDDVVVSYEPASGYELATLTYSYSGGAPIDIVNGTFTMPAANVTVSATFTEVVDYATLPFAHTANPWQNAQVTGMTQSLGSDYSGGGAGFKTQGDWLQVKFAETPGTLSYALKGNPSQNQMDYVFDVYESATGVAESWTSVKHHTTSENALSTSEYTTFTAELLASSRFVKFVYTTKTKGNVGLNSLVIEAASVTKYTVTVDSSIQHGTVMADKAEAAEGTPVNVTVSPDRGYALATLQYNGTDIVNGSFTMPAADVEVTATFTAVPVYKRIESAADFVTGAKYLVVAHKDGTSGYTSALKNVATENDQISVDETLSIEFADDGKFISVDSAAIVWQILHTSSVAGEYVLFNEAANVYAAALSTGNKAQLLSADDGNLAQWTFDFADVPEVKMYSLAYPTRWLQRNGTINNKFFATYDTTGTEPWLFIDTSTDAQTVYFDWNDGSGTVTSMKYVKGDQYPWFERLEKPDAYLVGWYDAPTGGNRVRLGRVSDADERTLYAHWETQQTVKFDPNGGTCDPTSKAFDIGGTYSGFPTPVWDGHDFLGWFTAEGDAVANGDDVTYAKSRTLYAHWSGLDTTKVVTFNPNGGTCGTATLTCWVGGTYPTFPTPQLKGSVFLGWFDSAGTRIKGGMEVVDADPLTLYAHWTSSQTVTLDPNGGTCATATVEGPLNGVYPEFPVPDWAGQTFLGWFTAPSGGTRVQAGDFVTSDLSRTLYAQWEGDEVQVVSFNPNGGTCKQTSMTCAIGSTYPTFPTPRLAGSKFKGWYDADGKRVKGGMEVSDDSELELFARWQAGTAATSITSFSVSRSASTARGVRAASVECTLWVETVADVAYEVLWTDSLGDEWTLLKSWIATDDGETSVTVEIPADSVSGFFRVGMADVE